MRVASAACDCGMLFITVTLLMMQLQSFSLLFLVLSVVPLGLIGVVAALLLFRQPLGFVAILGIRSLLGMIARNGVILIDQIQAVRAEGVAVWNAVIEAATSRFRPIMLGGISTVLGMIPIAPTIFWGPMAYAIMGGRAPGGDAVDVAVPSRALRRLVPRQGAGRRRARTGCTIRRSDLIFLGCTPFLFDPGARTRWSRPDLTKRASRSSDHACQDGDAYRMRSGFGLELFARGVEKVVHPASADAEPIGNFLLAITQRITDEAQLLPRRQRGMDTIELLFARRHQLFHPRRGEICCYVQDLSIVVCWLEDGGGPELIVHCQCEQYRPSSMS